MTSFEIPGGSAGLMVRALSRGDDGLVDRAEFVLFDENVRGRTVVGGHYSDSFVPLAVWAEGLAEGWRGWSGERAYESLDGDVTLTALHHGSRIGIDVDLRGSSHPEAWRMRVWLSIEAGEEFARVARAISVFGRSRGRLTESPS